MTDKTRVYDLKCDDVVFKDVNANPMVNAFLAAHGVDPNQFLVGDDITVYRLADGTYQLSTMVVPDGFPLCDTCQSCVRREPVEVPLTAPVPLIGSSFLWPAELGDLPVVQPKDPIAAAESAHQSALEVSARLVAQAHRMVESRQESLVAARIRARAVQA